MARGRANYRLVKIHRSYTVAEAAAVLRVDRNTVRQWITRGLPTCDARRPVLILGHDLIAFLKARRAVNKRPCAPGEIYCVRCRVPRNPAGDLAEYQPMTATLGNLVGICPTCDTLIFRRVNRTKLELVRGTLELTERRRRNV
jgi:excisionase family DNA binding protein